MSIKCRRSEKGRMKNESMETIKLGIRQDFR